jgi:hypothetical protein
LDNIDRRNRSALLPIIRGHPIDTAYLYLASVHESDIAVPNGTGIDVDLAEIRAGLL